MEKHWCKNGSYLNSNVCHYVSRDAWPVVWRVKRRRRTDEKTPERPRRPRSLRNMSLRSVVCIHAARCLISKKTWEVFPHGSLGYSPNTGTLEYQKTCHIFCWWGKGTNRWPALLLVNKNLMPKIKLLQNNTIRRNLLNKTKRFLHNLIFINLHLSLHTSKHIISTQFRLRMRNKLPDTQTTSIWTKYLFKLNLWHWRDCICS